MGQINQCLPCLGNQDDENDQQKKRNAHEDQYPYKTTRSYSQSLAPSNRYSCSESIDKSQNYIPQQILCRSEHSKVVLVQSTINKKYFVMKQIRKDDIKQKYLQTNIFRELQALEMCRSPFIVFLVETFQNSERLFYIIEFCQGGDLYNMRLKNGLKTFQESQARFYIAEILLALKCIHDHGFIYRNLSNKNVLLDAKGHIKLCDFFFSHDETKLGPCKSTDGPEVYQAPEIFTITGHDYRADFWSLGALLYELLQGRPPHFDLNSTVMKQNRMQGQLDFPIKISPQAEDLLRQLLNNAPDYRLTNFEAIKEHQFFNGIDWQAAERKELVPPFVPVLQGDSDLSYFPINQNATLKDSQAQIGSQIKGFSFSQKQNE